MNKEYGCSVLCEAALMYINAELCRVMWNLFQDEYDSPFLNSGNVEGFKNETFEVHSYDWNNETSQNFNFKWQHVEISWYKHYKRSCYCNQSLSADKIEQMLASCIDSLNKYENEMEKLYENHPWNACISCGRIIDTTDSRGCPKCNLEKF